jgi:hypothetical protein
MRVECESSKFTPRPLFKRRMARHCWERPGSTTSVRPGAAGLHIGIECSRVRDSSWMYLTSLVTTRIGVELAAVQRKLLDRAVVGLQLYSARTFHVNLSPRIYKGGQVPPRNTSTLKAIQTTTQDVGYYATCGPNLSKSLCSLHHRVLEQSIPTYKPYC